MSAVIIIPARYDSTRFPGKPLVSLKGKPLIQHVYENAQGALHAEGVIVATDSEMIFETVSAFGGKAVMTSRDHASGTDRVAEVARSITCDIIVNVQGDEPLINPRMIDDVIDLLSDKRADMGTLVKGTQQAEEIADPNIVKAVFSHDGYALYFSRAPIPFHRDYWRDTRQLTGHPKVGVFKHIGLYSYRREALLRLTALRPTRLEEIERLEQLRALEHGFRIKVKETEHETIGVDTPQDLERVTAWLNSYS